MHPYFVSPNYLLIECVINPSAGNTLAKNPFGTIKQLQNCRVVAIETFSAQDVTNSPISSGNAVIQQSVFMTSFLTLYRASTPGHIEGLYYDQVPLSSLRRVNNYATATTTSNSNSLFHIKPAEISWTKSYVTCLPAVALGAAQSAIFGVHYLLQNEPWQTYQ